MLLPMLTCHIFKSNAGDEKMKRRQSYNVSLLNTVIKVLLFVQISGIGTSINGYSVAIIKLNYNKIVI